MKKEMNSFQDLLREEFEIEDIILDDEDEEAKDMLDIVISDNDERRAELEESAVDSFINDIDLAVEQIVKEEKEIEMENLMEFFDEDAEIFEEAMDAFEDEEEEINYNPDDSDSIDDEGEMIDALEGLPELDEEGLLEEEE